MSNEIGLADIFVVPIAPPCNETSTYSHIQLLVIHVLMYSMQERGVPFCCTVNPVHIMFLLCVNLANLVHECVYVCMANTIL